VSGSPAGPDPAAPDPAAPDPGSAPPPPEPDAPGLSEQVRSTRDSAKRLVDAHVELARAEFADISDAIKRVVMYAGIAIGAAIFAGLLVAIGTPLFLGEWLFRSIGWGILLGLLLMLAIVVAAVVLALKSSRGPGVGRPFFAAALIGIVVGVVLGLDLTNRGWTALGDAIATNLDPASRPLLLAVGILAAIGAVVGLVGGLAGAGGRVGGAGLVGGAVLGALLGALTAIATGPRVGAAIGVAVGLIAWIGLMGVGLARNGVDTDEMKHRFWPERTIEVTKETIEWARERIPRTRRS
jgi:hypothetical protein